MRTSHAFAFWLSAGFAAALQQKQLPLSPINLAHDYRRPNIVFVLTDDQDVHLNSLQYMPSVQKHLVHQGTHFTKHYCTTAVCCPSRVTLWTGKAAHNTNITDVNPPYGGYPKFVAQGYNENYLPIWLQAAGYNTYYTGKLFNAHTVDNYDSPFPAGFNGTDFLVDPFTYNYLNSSFQRNQDPPRSYEGQYSTDVLAEKALRLLDEAVIDIESRPFFLTIAPIAPHANIYINGSLLDGYQTLEFGPPVAAERHRSLFKDVKVPRTPNFNPDKPSGANWVARLPQQNTSNVGYNDHYYRQRLRALQAVDDMVDGLFSSLEESNLLDNTYIFYSSDNGFHIGQHRLQPGKSCGYEEDINVPLIVRGPGITANYSAEIVTTHTDLAPTFLQLLDIPLRDEFDGKPIPMTQAEIETAYERRREHLNVEYWGFAGGEGKYDRTLHENNTYKAIRCSSPEYNLYYSVWCTNEHELYDMTLDPGQLNNLLSPQSPASTRVAGLPISKVVARLDALLFVLKSCEGSVCREPWKALHPEGDVASLADALAARFDSFYESQQIVQYNFCANGYLVDAEGPMWPASSQVTLTRHGLSWDLWV